MQTPFYANAGDSSPKKLTNPSLCLENRLNLLPEQRDKISQAFTIQISRVSLTPTEYRILNVIYNQTIFFDKREDDINGKWFEHFMGVRNDHANQAVRHLEALNILITHRGHYGKWISINFDLDNWGKVCPESQTNDPYCLLPEEYQPYKPQDEIEFSLYRPPVETTTTAEPAPSVTTPEPLETPPSVPVSEPIEAPCVALPAPIKSTSVAAPQPIEPPQSVATPTPSAPATATPTPTFPPFELNYPTSLPKKLCDHIAGQLKGINLQEEAQGLLNYFAVCLQKGGIRNPMAYFVSLKQRLLKGQLGLPETQSVIETHAKKKKTADQVLIEQHLEYQDAVADHNQLKRTIESIMNSAQCAFDTALKTMYYTEIWEKACQRLDNIKKVMNINETTDNVTLMSG